MSTQLALNTERIRSFLNRDSNSLYRVFTAASQSYSYLTRHKKDADRIQRRELNSASPSDRYEKEAPCTTPRIS